MGGNEIRSMAIESTFSQLSSSTNLPEHPLQAPYRHQLGVFFRTTGGSLTSGMLPIRLGHMSILGFFGGNNSGGSDDYSGAGESFSMNDFRSSDMSDTQRFINDLYTNPHYNNTAHAASMDAMRNREWGPIDAYYNDPLTLIDPVQSSINNAYDDPSLAYTFDQRQDLDRAIGDYVPADHVYDQTISRDELTAVKDAGGFEGTTDEFIDQFGTNLDDLEVWVKSVEDNSAADLTPLKTKLETSRIYGTNLYVVDNDVNADRMGDLGISQGDYDSAMSDPSLVAAMDTGKDSAIWNIQKNNYQDNSAAAQRATAMGLWGNKALGYPTWSEYMNKGSDWWKNPENADMASQLQGGGASYPLGNKWTQFLGQDANQPGWYSAATEDPKDPGISRTITTTGKQYDSPPGKIFNPLTGKMVHSPGYTGGEKYEVPNPYYTSYMKFEKSLPNATNPEGIGPSKFAQNFGDGASRVGGFLGDPIRYAGKGINYLSRGAGKLFGLIPGEMGDRLESGFNQFGAGVERFGTGVDDWMGSAPGDFIEGASAFGQGLGGYLSGDMRRGNASMGQAGRRFFEGGRDLIEVPARGITDTLGAFQTATNANLQIGGSGGIGRSSGGGIARRNPNATKRTTTPSQRGSLINNSRSNTPGTPGSSNTPGRGSNTPGGGGSFGTGATPRRENSAIRITPKGNRVDLRKPEGQKKYLADGGTLEGLNQILGAIEQRNMLGAVQLSETDDSFDLSNQYQDVDYTPASRPEEDHPIEDLAAEVVDELEEEPDVPLAFQT